MDRDDVTVRLDSEQAARTIQRVYRGYRTRRELQGFALAASTRRLEPTPRPPKHFHDASERSDPHLVDGSPSPARQNWHRAVNVAIQASGNDEVSATPPAASNTMDLSYFLEMVDTRHRHGSNLRAYHTFWKSSTSGENFFYWLDQGEGKHVDLPQCSRERLERDQVRYLSPGERQNYLVKIDQAGKFRWAKNDELVDTNDKRFRDSLHGVVPVEDDAPRFRGNSNLEKTPSEPESSRSSVSQGHTSDESNEEQPPSTREDYELKQAVKKFSNVSLSAKRGMWIFVADTSFRIYVGIKEPGAFQHSSFLRGGRIAAAGTLKIKSGQLRSLALMSGHYRPHIANLRAFHHSLQDRGVDLSRVSISKSYAVLAGIEGYTSTKRKMRAMHEKLGTTRDKIHPMHPHAADAGG